MILNCDLVIAAEDALIATPEVKRGVVAIMGGTLTCVVSFKVYVFVNTE